MRSRADTVFPPGDWRTAGDEPEDPDEVDLFAPDRLPAALEVVDGDRDRSPSGSASRLAQLALAWNVAQPGVTAAIAGSRNPDHVRSNAAAGDLELDEATLTELDALLVGGGF